MNHGDRIGIGVFLLGCPWFSWYNLVSVTHPASVDAAVTSWLAFVAFDVSNPIFTNKPIRWNRLIGLLANNQKRNFVCPIQQTCIPRFAKRKDAQSYETVGYTRRGYCLIQFRLVLSRGLTYLHV